MGLADIVATAPAPRSTGGAPCSVGHLIDTLDTTDRDALLLILYGETRARGGWGRSAAAVHQMLTAAGLAVSFQQINRHRRGHCGCGSDG